MTPSQPNADPRGRRDPNRRVIDVHCTTHGGPRGFTNLVVTKRDGLIEMDPHVTGQCVIIFYVKAAADSLATTWPSPG